MERVLAVPSHSLDGKKIDPKHATPKSKSKANKTKKIFVGGVSQETSADEVKAYFSQFGKVEEAVMLMDQQTKRHRGFGFVTFENEDVVDRVCEIHFHTIKNKKVECKKAQPKEAVQAANTAALLGKRVILSNLGIPTLQSQPGLPGMTTPAVTGLPGLIQQTPSIAALAAAQSQAAALGYGKLLQAAGAVPNSGTPGSQPGSVVTSASGGGPQPAGLPSALSSFRYAPYPMPSAISALSASQAVQQAAALAAQQQAAVVAQQQNNPQQTSQQQQSSNAASAGLAQQAAAAAQAVAQQQAAAAVVSNPAAHPSVSTGGTGLNALTTMPTVTLALASNPALQTFAQSGAPAAVIPSVTASGGLAAPGLTGPTGAASAAAAGAGQLGQPGGNPMTAAAAAAAAAAAQAGNPYSGYSLTNVDMSSFQGVDWSSVYGMGMYV